VNCETACSVLAHCSFHLVLHPKGNIMHLGVFILAILLAIWLKSDGVQLAPDADSEIFGVCAGIAYRYGHDVTTVRIVALIWALCLGGGVLTYVILWAFLPERNRA
jgi:phage shock protein C